MMDKKDYFKMKMYIRTLCMDNLLELAQKMGLNNYETTLLKHQYLNSSRVHISFSLHVCESKISKDTRRIFLKIYDYLKRNDIQI